MIRTCKNAHIVDKKETYGWAITGALSSCQMRSNFSWASNFWNGERKQATYCCQSKNPLTLIILHPHEARVSLSTINPLTIQEVVQVVIYVASCWLIRWILTSRLPWLSMTFWCLIPCKRHSRTYNIDNDELGWLSGEEIAHGYKKPWLI